MQGLNWEFYEISGTPFKKKISNYLQLKKTTAKKTDRELILSKHVTHFKLKRKTHF